MAPYNVVMIGPFGLYPRMTMRVRALPLAKTLAARGHIVTVLLPPWQNPEDAGQSWEEEGVRIENVRLPRGVPGWFHWRLTEHLVQRARQLVPDVVHAFKPKAYAGLAHLTLARRWPIVVDTDDWEGAGGWNDMGVYPIWMQRFFAWQERWGLTHADAVTVASRALQTLTWSIRGSSDRVFYLPNGAQPPREVALRADGERSTILLYTRFFEFDLKRLWRIMDRVRTHRPEVRFLVVGKGFAEEEKVLLRKARLAGWRVAEPGAFVPDGELPFADLVYVGWGTTEMLPRCFAAADVAMYPFDDTLLNRTKCPVKLLDLLAAGIPVVGDAVGQIAETIVEGRTGRLVCPGDEAAFAAALLDLLGNRQRLAAMRQAAQADMGRRYTWDRLAGVAEAAYHAAYRSHAGGNKGSMV